MMDWKVSIDDDDDENEEDLVRDLLVAYRNARSNKRTTKTQMRFEMDLSRNFESLYYALANRTYKPSRHSCFIVRDPVKREVFASPFRDRVVHHFIFNCVNKVLDEDFIPTSFSCREDRGTLFGRNCLAEAIKICSRGYTQECYVAKLDISGYFMHIDRAVLWEIIEKKLSTKTYPHKDLVDWLIKVIIFDDPLKGVRMRGSKSEWDGLPPSKSFFFSPPGCGLPIGNLTSQLFSNVYLSVLDDYVMRDLGFHFYGRYVDDFYIVDRDKAKILDGVAKIRVFIEEKLHLTLHPKKFYLQPVEKGVEFLGGVILPKRTLVSRRSIKKVKRCFRENLTYSSPDSFKSLNSYLGYLHHFSAANLVDKNLIYPLIFDPNSPVFDNNVLVVDSDFHPKRPFPSPRRKLCRHQHHQQQHQGSHSAPSSSPTSCGSSSSATSFSSTTSASLPTSSSAPQSQGSHPAAPSPELTSGVEPEVPF